VLVVALSLSGQVTKIGAYAGFAAFFGFAVLSILCFAQAREIKRLRDWAGRAPERAAELEARVMADAARRSRPVAATPAGAVRPALPAAVPVPVAAGAAAAGAAPAVAEAGTAVAVAEGGGDGDETPAATDGAAPPAEGEAPAVDGEVKPNEAVAEETPAEGEAKPAEETPAADASDEAAPAEGDAKPAEAAPAAVAEPVEPEPAATPNGAAAAGEVPPLPRATPPPRPGGVAPPARARPAVPAAPLRAAGPPTRRPVTPSRRPAPAPEPAGRGAGRTAALGAGGLLGLVVLVFAVTQIFGGSDEKPKPNVPVTETTAEPTSTPKPSSSSASSVPARADTVVGVLNGTTVTGLAKTTLDKIAQAGFKPGVVADFTDQARSASLVFYGDGAKRRAIEVAKLLSIPTSEVQPMDQKAQELAGADAKVVVVTGADQTQ
jgi:hypothetical protein